MTITIIIIKFKFDKLILHLKGFFLQNFTLKIRIESQKHRQREKKVRKNSVRGIKAD